MSGFQIFFDASQGARLNLPTHRWSVSSENGYDVEARASSSRPRADSTGRSPMGRIAGRLLGMKDSVASLQTESVWTAKTNYAWDIRLLFKRRITDLYVSFSSLKSYVEVNYSGFRKILKKYVLDTLERVGFLTSPRYDKVTYNEVGYRARGEFV